MTIGVNERSLGGISPLGKSNNRFPHDYERRLRSLVTAGTVEVVCQLESVGVRRNIIKHKEVTEP